MPVIPSGFISDDEHVQLQRRIQLIEMQTSAMAKQKMLENQILLQETYKSSKVAQDEAASAQRAQKIFFKSKGSITMFKA